MILPAHPLGHQAPPAPPKPPAQGQQSFFICSAPRSSGQLQPRSSSFLELGSSPASPQPGTHAHPWASLLRSSGDRPWGRTSGLGLGSSGLSTNLNGGLCFLSPATRRGWVITPYFLASVSWVLGSGVEALLFQDADLSYPLITAKPPCICRVRRHCAHENPLSPPGAVASPSTPGPEGSSPGAEGWQGEPSLGKPPTPRCPASASGCDPVCCLYISGLS